MKSIHGNCNDSAEVNQLLGDAIAEFDCNLLILSISPTIDALEATAGLKDSNPGLLIHISSSCIQGFSNHGTGATDGLSGFSAMLFSDSQGDYAVGMAEFCEECDLSVLAEKTLEDAIKSAGREGEVPDLIWLASTPGNEELVLKGLNSGTGGLSPIFGGSAADNEIAGNWFLSNGESVIQNGLMICVMYPDCTIGAAFRNGYSPTEYRGKVTSAEGRLIREIDSKPAAEVYNSWANGAFGEFMQGGNILAASTLQPLGIEIERIAGVPYHNLIHPDSITAEGGLTLFANVEEGAELIFMQGEPTALINRTKRVVNSALKHFETPPQKIHGALLTYCAGCMLATQSDLNTMVSSVQNELDNSPFIGQFTFGEQGQFPNGESAHGNLMISAVVFAD